MYLKKSHASNIQGFDWSIHSHWFRWWYIHTQGFKCIFFTAITLINYIYTVLSVCDMGWSLSTLLFISNVSADAMDFVHSAALPVSDKRKEAAQVSLVISCAFQWESANGWSKSKSNYCVRNSHSLCLILGREVCDLVLMKRKWPEKKKKQVNLLFPSQATILTLSTLTRSVTSLNSTSFRTKVHTLSQNL